MLSKSKLEKAKSFSLIALLAPLCRFLGNPPSNETFSKSRNAKAASPPTPCISRRRHPVELSPTTIAKTTTTTITTSNSPSSSSIANTSLSIRSHNIPPLARRHHSTSRPSRDIGSRRPHCLSCHRSRVQGQAITITRHLRPSLSHGHLLCRGNSSVRRAGGKWIIYWWLSARLQYLQSVSSGDTAVLHEVIEIS